MQARQEAGGWKVEKNHPTTWCGICLLDRPPHTCTAWDNPEAEEQPRPTVRKVSSPGTAGSDFPQEVLPAFPCRFPGFPVALGGIGCFAGPHEAVAGALVDDRLVGLASCLHQLLRLWNGGVDAGIVAPVEAIDRALDLLHG